APRRKGQACASPCTVALPPRVELETGQGEQQGEKDDGEGARSADAQVQENLLVDGVDEERRRLRRSTLGHDADDVERLKRNDEARRGHEGGGRAKERPHDPAEAGEWTCAVERRGLEQRSGDRLEAGEKDNHGVTRDFPDRDRRERRE